MHIYIGRALWAVLAVLGAWGCGGHSTGAQCEVNSDCETNLVCAGQFCRAQCRGDADCSPGLLCRASGQANKQVCVPPDAPLLCLYTSECTAPLVCARDGVCRAQCRTDRDCSLYGAGMTCHL